MSATQNSARWKSVQCNWTNVQLLYYPGSSSFESCSNSSLRDNGLRNCCQLVNNFFCQKLDLLLPFFLHYSSSIFCLLEFRKSRLVVGEFYSHRSWVVRVNTKQENFLLKVSCVIQVQFSYSMKANKSSTWFCKLESSRSLKRAFRFFRSSANSFKSLNSHETIVNSLPILSK